MKIFSRVNTAIQEWYSVSTIPSLYSTNLTSMLHTITNSPHVLQTLTPSRQDAGMAKASSTAGNGFFSRLTGTQTPDTGPLPAANGTFSRVYSLYGDKRSELYALLDHYLTIPDEIAPEDMTIREKKITPTATEVTLNWSQTSPAYSPRDSEKTPSGMQVSEQLLHDLSRASYIIKLPGLDDNAIKLDNSMTDEEKIAHLHGIFGEENTKIISEIAHQGHMAEFAGIGLAMCKNDHLISQGNAVPQFIISKQEDGSCRITSSLTFKVKNIITEDIVEGLFLEMKRTNVLHPAPDNKGKLRSGTGEEKNGMSFNIKYIKSDTTDVLTR